MKNAALCMKLSAKTHTGVEMGLNQDPFPRFPNQEYLNSPGPHPEYLLNFPPNMYIPPWLEK